MDASGVRSRRKFLREISGGIAAGIAMPLLSEAADDRVKICILHTNDVHSHIDPFDDNDPKYPGMGGAARRSALIKKIRSGEPNVLLFDAGDLFQGTPYFNMYHGELDVRLMNYMAYDAATIGNHDFDDGIDNLSKQLQKAAFPMLNSNYEFKGTPMEGRSKPYKIFNKAGIRVGVFGLGIELSGLVDDRLTGKTKYTDPVASALKISAYLKQQKKCSLIICLSHLGYHYDSEKISDTVLAENTADIDLIIGGHTHTFLDEPVKMMNNMHKEVLIAQAGWAGLRLGRIDYYFDRKDGKKILSTSSKIDLKKSSEI